MQVFIRSNLRKALSVLAIVILTVLLVWALSQWFNGFLPVPAELKIGIVNLHIYSVILFAGFLSGYAVTRRIAVKFGYDLSKIDNMVIWVVLLGFVGARLHHVFTTWEYYIARPSEVFYIWQGGLGIFGGIAGGLIAAILYSLKQKWQIIETLGLLPVGLALGQAIGRWGNFFNQEAFGKPTQVWWKMFVSFENRPDGYFNESYFHPVFLYESLAMLIVFLILYYHLKRARDGRREVLALYFIFYGIVRFMTEQLRVDSVSFDGFHANQVLALASVVVGLVLWWRAITDDRIVNKDSI